MARLSYGCTLVTTLANGAGFVMTAGSSGPAPSQAAVEAAVATLEADGATPTQAHVTALRGVWNTLVTGLNAHDTADVVLDVNTANITTQTKLREALRQLNQVIAGSGLST